MLVQAYRERILGFGPNIEPVEVHGSGLVVIVDDRRQYKLPLEPLAHPSVSVT